MSGTMTRRSYFNRQVIRSLQSSLKNFTNLHRVVTFRKMKATKTLGMYDANGQPKAGPNYCFGEVVN